MHNQINGKRQIASGAHTQDNHPVVALRRGCTVEAHGSVFASHREFKQVLLLLAELDRPLPAGHQLKHALALTDAG